VLPQALSFPGIDVDLKDQSTLLTGRLNHRLARSLFLDAILVAIEQCLDFKDVLGLHECKHEEDSCLLWVKRAGTDQPIS
jgi:hypothetical protein